MMKKGDNIQWLSGGVDQFPSPKRITKIQNSEHGTFVFVEGSNTGIPINEVRVVIEGDSRKPANKKDWWFNRAGG